MPVDKKSQDVLSVFVDKGNAHDTPNTTFGQTSSGFHKTRVFLPIFLSLASFLERLKTVPEAIAGPTPFKLESAPMAASKSFLLKMALNAFLLSCKTTLGVFIWIKSFRRGRNTPR